MEYTTLPSSEQAQRMWYERTLTRVNEALSARGLSPINIDALAIIHSEFPCWDEEDSPSWD